MDVRSVGTAGKWRGASSLCQHGQVPLFVRKFHSQTSWDVVLLYGPGQGFAGIEKPKLQHFLSMKNSEEKRYQHEGVFHSTSKTFFRTSSEISPWSGKHQK